MTFAGQFTKSKKDLVPAVQCKICPDNYPKDDEDSHLRGHQDLVFRCRICAGGNDFGLSPVFVMLSEAVAHGRTVHCGDDDDRSGMICPRDVRSMQCTVCDLFILSRGVRCLGLHLRTAHDISVDRNFAKAGKFAKLGCRVCDFVTSNIVTWEHHFRNAYLSCRQAVLEPRKKSPPRKQYRRRRRQSSDSESGSSPKRSRRSRASSSSDSSSSSRSSSVSSESGSHKFRNPKRLLKKRRQDYSPRRESDRSAGNHSSTSPVPAGTQFKCGYCKISLSGLTSYHQHMIGKKHWGEIKDLTEIRFSCLVCNESMIVNPDAFLKHLSSKKHIKRIPSAKGLLPPHITALQTSNLNNSGNIAYGYFSCEICKIPDLGVKKNYLEHFSGRKHLSNMEEYSPMRFRCQICCTSFTFGPADLVKHMNEPGHFRPEERKNFDGAFNESRGNRNRIDLTEPVLPALPEVSHKCDVCKVVRRNMRSLQSHLESEDHLLNVSNLLAEGPYSSMCSVCGKEVSAASINEYKMHFSSLVHIVELSNRISEEAANEQKIDFNDQSSKQNGSKSKCNENRASTSTSELNSSICVIKETSANKKEPKDDCNFCVGQVPSAKFFMHLVSKHREYLYECRICIDSLYLSVKGIINHLTDKHKDMKNPLLVLPKDFAYFICPFCRPIKKFCSALVNVARKHIRTDHEEELTADIEEIVMPVQCRICNRLFEEIKEFNLHPCSVQFQESTTYLRKLQTVIAMEN